MKKYIIALTMLFAFSIAFTSCRDEKKTPEDKIEAAIEDVKTEVEESSEEISDDVEDALEDVEDEIKEVKEEATQDK
jgi:gas vesicle protein